MKFQHILASFLMVTLFVSCRGKEEDAPQKPSLTVPSTYNGADFTNNAVDELALGTSLESLVTEMKKGNTSTTTLVSATLKNIYTAGSVSLSNTSVAGFRDAVSANDGYFDQMVLASGKTWTPETPTIGSTGGVYGAYLFDENGVEYTQVIEKGLYTASFYNRLLSLTSGNFDVAAVDQAIALFGAHPNFVNSNNKTLHATDFDRFSAGYVARRDKNDGTGFYTTAKYNFIKTRAAIEAGADYSSEKATALQAIKMNWEKGVMATICNYANDAQSNLSLTSPTATTDAKALHSISEIAGFLSGWSYIAESDRIVTDAQLADCFGFVNYTTTGTPSIYLFQTDRVNQISKLTSLRTKLKQVYGFSDQDLIDFNTDWVSSQAR